MTDTNELGQPIKGSKWIWLPWGFGLAVVVLVVLGFGYLSIFAPEMMTDPAENEVANDAGQTGPSGDADTDTDSFGARDEVPDEMPGRSGSGSSNANGTSGRSRDEVLAALWGDSDDNPPSNTDTRSDNERMRQEAAEYAERQEMTEGHALNRSESYVLAKEREIDINAEISEFAEARQEWEELIQHLLISDEGKRLSLDDKLIEGFIELYKKRPLRPGWAEAMHGQLDILLQPVVATISEKYSQSPGEVLESEVHGVATKANENAQDIKRDTSILRGLVARAPARVPAGTPTLAEAIVAYDARRHSQEFLDERDLKKQAEKEAKRQREEQIRQQQLENQALSNELLQRTERLKEEADRLARENAELQTKREQLEEEEAIAKVTTSVIEEKKEKLKEELRQAAKQPSREDLEANANRGFAMASYFRPASERSRGGVIHVDYNGLLAPPGKEPCDIWRSEDGKSVFVHSGGETIALPASSVRSIVYPSRP